MKILAIVNQKGGVGKSMLAASLSGALTELKRKVLVVDMDAQASLSGMLAKRPEAIKQTMFHVLVDEVEISDIVQPSKMDYLWLVPSSKAMKGLELKLASDPLDAIYLLRDALNDITDDFDIVLIDTPPKLDLATRMALVAADGIIIPIECQRFAFEATSAMLNEIQTVKKRVNPELKMLGFVINKFSATRKVEQMYNQALRQKYKELVFKTEFRNNVQYTEACTLGLPITHAYPRSSQAQTVRNFITELNSAIAA